MEIIPLDVTNLVNENDLLVIKTISDSGYICR